MRLLHPRDVDDSARAADRGARCGRQSYPRRPIRQFVPLHRLCPDHRSGARSARCLKPAAPDEPRGLIQIEPKLDFGALEPGRAAIDAIRQAADELKLGPMFGARVRLTGQVVINDEQFVTLRKGMLPNLAGTVLAVLLILWLALRSAHTNVAVFVSLCVGLVV